MALESVNLGEQAAQDQLQNDFQFADQMATQEFKNEQFANTQVDYSSVDDPLGDLGGLNPQLINNEPTRTDASITNVGGGPGDPVPAVKGTLTKKDLVNQYNQLKASNQTFGKTLGIEKIQVDPMLAAGEYTFDQYATNVDRYRGYGKSTFNKLGFNPLDDNEVYYNANTSGFQDFKRMTGQFGTLFGTAFFSNYRAVQNFFTGGSGFDPDIEAAEEYEKAMRLGMSSKETVWGKTSNFALNMAYTAGIGLNVVAEELLIAAVTAATAPATGGGSAAGGAAVAGARLAAAGRSLDRLNDIMRLTKMNLRSSALVGGTSTMLGGGMQFFKNLKNINNAREFWSGARVAGSTFGKGALKFVNPLTGTTEAVKGIYEGSSAYRNLGNFAKMSKGFGAFYRDVRENMFALSESQLEGGGVYNQVLDQQVEFYKQTHDGQMPDQNGWATIYSNAEKAGELTTMINMPMIFLSNRFVFDGLFRFKGLAGAMDAAEQAAVKNTANGIKWDLSARTFSEQAMGFASRAKNAVFKSPKVYLGNFLNYSKANFAEGLQEIMQESTGSAVTNYYVNTYKNPALGSADYARAMAWSGIKEFNPFTSSQGLEVFLSGFLMGGAMKGVTNTLTGVLNKSGDLYSRTFQKERYAEYVQNKTKSKQQALESLNAIMADPEAFFSRKKESIVNQSRANQNMAESEANDDDKTFYDSKDEKTLDHIFTALDTKTFDLVISALKDMGKLSDVELAQAFNLQEGSKAKDKLTEYIGRANQIKDIYRKVNAEFSNPFNPKKFKKVDANGQMNANYINETLAYKAYEDAKKLAIASQYGFTRATERLNALMADLSTNRPVMSASATDFTVLQNKDLLQNEIAILSDEIKQLETSEDPKQKELAGKKKAKLNSLVKYSNALEKHQADVKSQTSVDNKGQFSIPFNEETITPLQEAYREYLKTIANINNDKYVFDSKIDDSFKKILDIYNLDKDAQNYLQNINGLTNPEMFARHATIINQTYRDMYENRQKLMEESFDNLFNVYELNNLTKYMAELGVKLTDDELQAMVLEGTMPTQYLDLLTGQPLPETDERVAKVKEAIDTFVKLRQDNIAKQEADEAEEEARKEAAKTAAKPKEEEKPKEEPKPAAKPKAMAEDLKGRLQQAYDEYIDNNPDAVISFDEYVETSAKAAGIKAQYEAEQKKKAEPKPAEEEKVIEVKLPPIEVVEEVTQAPTAAPVSDIEAKKADIEKRRQEALKPYDERDARSLEAAMPNNPNHPTIKVGMKRANGLNVVVEKTNTDNWNGEGEGYTIITAVKSPAEFDSNGVMTKVAKVEEAVFNSKEEAEAAVQTTFERVKSLAGKKQKEINAKYDAELAALEGAKPAEAPTEVVAEKPVEKKPKPITIQNGKVTITPTPTDTFSQTYTFTVKDGKVVEGRHRTFFQGEYRDRQTDDPISNPAEEYDILSAAYSEQQITQDSSDVVKETSGTEKAKSILDSVSSIKELPTTKLTDNNAATAKLLELVAEGKISSKDLLTLVEQRRNEILEKMNPTDLSKNDYVTFTDGRKGWVTSTNAKKNTVNVKMVGSAKGVVETIGAEDLRKNLVSVETKKVVKVEAPEQVAVSKADKETITESRDTMDEFKNDAAKTKQIADEIAKSDKTDNTDNLNDLLDSLGCDI
jgi:hypothetical protein